jgi:hypothetical protein
MKYRLIERKIDRSSRWSKGTTAYNPNTAYITISAVNPEERVDGKYHKPTPNYWYAPESIPVAEAIQMFVDSEVARLLLENELNNLTIQALIKHKTKLIDGLKNDNNI